MRSGDGRSGGDQLEHGGAGHDVDGVEEGVDDVLGWARTGLIFTRNQEGTQLGGVTQPGQTEQGIPYHVVSCWVLVGGAGLGWEGNRATAWAKLQQAVRKHPGGTWCA